MPVFASPDIAALVAAFPPASPTQDRPSLVRSRSEERLLDAQHVLHKFRDLLDTSSTRIKISDLPARLGIVRADWILDVFPDPIHRGQDSRELLSKQVVECLLTDALNESSKHPINASAFAITNDISKATLQSLLTSKKQEVLFHWWDDNDSQKQTYFYSGRTVESFKQWRESRSWHAADYKEGIDLGNVYPVTLPAALLVHLVEQAGPQPHTPPGSWQILDGRPVFIPESYKTDLEKKERAAYEGLVDDYVSKVLASGYCLITKRQDSSAGLHNGEHSDMLVQAVLDRAQRSPQICNNNYRVVTLATDTGVIVATQARLEEVNNALNSKLKEVASSIWHERDAADSASKLRSSTIQRLHGLDGDGVLFGVLALAPSHQEKVNQILDAAFDEMDGLDRKMFATKLFERLLGPLQLYMNGIDVVKDTTLQEHLQEYVGDHFRREILPALVDDLRKGRLLLDRTRRKDVDKFSEAVSQAKVLSDIHAASTKLARKHKVDSSSADLLQQTKEAALRQNLKYIRKITRGSDILQNVIWVLLARCTDGLYMSPGKDTTRMIKHFALISGNSETSKQLEQWRDALKAGTADDATTKNMGELAAAVVESSVVA